MSIILNNIVRHVMSPELKVADIFRILSE